MSAIGRDVAALFPPSVLAAAAPPEADETVLLAEERPLVARAVAGRRREFASARKLARELLARLGHPAFPLLRDPDRVPLWPPGVVGSISHTKDLCAVAVARVDDVRGIGLDVERAGAVESHLWPSVCTDAERRWLETRPEEERSRLATALFSAKESVYKCLFPLDRRRRGFHDVEVALDPAAGRFEATDRAGDPAARLVGALVLHERWALTGVVLA